MKQVAQEMENYKMEILGLSEVRWFDFGELKTGDGLTLLYSGLPEESGAVHRDGVGILLTAKARQSLMDWKPVSERIITARFNSKIRNITVVQCYAPTEVSEIEKKEEFYALLVETVKKSPKRDLLIIMGDLNAKVGSINEGVEHVMGIHGEGQVNDNGERFINFCDEYDLVIGGTIFPHRRCHKVSWVSPDNATENQIDHIAISRKFRGCLTNVRNKRGADAGSDHHLIMAEFRMKIMACAQKFAKRGRKFDLGKLREDRNRDDFRLQLQNRFEALQMTPNVDIAWGEIQEIFTKTSKEVLGFKDPQKKEWMSEDTWKEIARRKELKAKINQSKTRQQKSQAQRDYSISMRNVKRKARRDQRDWINKQAQRAEDAARKGDLKELYSTTRLLGKSGFRKKRPIKDKQGVLLSSQEEQMKRWEEHFEEVLNRRCNAGEEQGFVQNENVALDINVDPPTRNQIIEAIKALKAGKAAGIDNLPPEVFKLDPELTAEILEPLLKMIWVKEEIPEQWKKGLIVKIPKKGDITKCDNWRGITLLSIVSKVLARIILGRIKPLIELQLRKEQAGFRENRSCIDLINTLRIIIEQSAEWQSPLYLAFIDFEKAFDSIDRECMWRILEIYGIPPKILNLIKGLYDGYKCQIIHDGVLSNPIDVTSGVKQGCILSPILFVTVLDMVMKTSLNRRRRGIQWGMQNRLEDLDFADDLCLLAQRHSDMREKLLALSDVAKKVGLKINEAKTKEMVLNVHGGESFEINGRRIERVDSFVYLGSMVNPEGGAEDDAKTRIRKANGVFSQLYAVWRNNKISKQTKLRIFNSNVKSVLLYGCETWKVTAEISKRLQVFINRCLRKIECVWWPSIISNEELWHNTGQMPIDIEIRKRKWRWIGHTLRKRDGAIEKDALQWNPQGRRKRGRPRISWRRTIESELGKVRKTWREVRGMAEDREGWRLFVDALCSNWSYRN